MDFLLVVNCLTFPIFYYPYFILRWFLSAVHTGTTNCWFKNCCCFFCSSCSSSCSRNCHHCCFCCTLHKIKWVPIKFLKYTTTYGNMLTYSYLISPMEALHQKKLLIYFVNRFRSFPIFVVGSICQWRAKFLAFKVEGPSKKSAN